MANEHLGEVSETFIEGMKKRMYVSYYKYGPLRNAFPHKVDALESLRLWLDEYSKTGNTEYLIDAANFCMIEFMFPRLPGAYFKPTDSDGSPGRILIDGEATQSKNSDLPY
jgi:hypothetical protein